MMNPKSKRTRFIYFIIFLFIFIAVAPFILLYSFGYNWSKNFSLLKTGGVYVYASQTGVNIYIDDVLDNTTSIFQHGILVKDLRPKNYVVKVSKDGYLDWRKNIKVKAEYVAEAYPFLIPQKVTSTPIPSQISKSVTATSTLVANAEYKNLLALFATSTKIVKPTTDVIATSSKATTTLPQIESKKVVIKKRDSTLEALWTGSTENTPFYFCIQNEVSCVNDFPVYSTDNIGTFDFYPSRNDVLIISVGPKLVVVELDKRSPQNIVELYQSQTQDKIDFRVVDNETLVVKEGKKLTKLSLVYAGK